MTSPPTAMNAGSAAILAGLAGVAATHEELEGLAEAALEQVLEGLGAQGGGLYAVEQGSPSLFLAGERGGSARLSPQLSPGEEDATARAVATGQLQLVEDARRQPLMGGSGSEAPCGWLAGLAVPLKLGEHLAGVLVIGYSGPRRFSPDELALARASANILAPAVHGALVSHKARTLERRLEFLDVAGSTISGAMMIVPQGYLQAAVRRGFHGWSGTEGTRAIPEFLEPVLRTIVEQARSAVGAQYAALGIAGSPSHPFNPWVFSGMSPEQVKAIGRFPRAVGTLGLVVREGQLLQVPDVRQHPAYQGLPPHHPEMTSFLGVPIRYRGLSLGNLYLANKQGAPEFTAEDRRIVEQFAGQVSLALQMAYFRSAMETQRAQLESMLDSAPAGILFVDAQGSFVMANPKAMELFGHAIHPEGGQTQFLGQLFHPDGRPLTLEELPSNEALRGISTASREVLILRPDGSRLPVEQHAAPVYSEDARLLGAVVVVEDLSARKELERLREEFAAMIAHDLRNPIQTIQLQTRLLLERGGETVLEVPRQALLRIQDSAQRLEKLVTDLLDMARIGLDRLQLTPRLADVGELITAVVERIRPLLGRHPVELEQHGRPMARLDPVRFDQILSNLLENAVRCSPEQAPLGIRVEPTVDGGTSVLVRDQGSGISPEDMPRLFERSVLRPRSRNQGGLGLGLPIVKGLVEAHGGRIWAESVLGEGTTFHLWFPPVTDSPEQQAPPTH